MSFEGYDYVICSKGHLTSQDSLCESDTCNHLVSITETGITHCHAEIVWRNTVDQTNGEEVGFIKESDMNKFIIIPEVTETCSHCGHTKKITSPACIVHQQEKKPQLFVLLLQVMVLSILYSDSLLNGRAARATSEANTVRKWRAQSREVDSGSIVSSGVWWRHLKSAIH